MALTKEAFLNTMALLFAALALDEHDTRTLTEMGFEPEDLEALRRMTLEEILQHYSRSREPVLQSRVNPQAFKHRQASVQRERETNALRDRLIAGDAPYALLHELFGTTTGEYTARRRLLKVEEGRGRPPEADEAMERRVWAVYHRLYPKRSSPLSGAEWLELHERTGASLRTLWMLVQCWSQEGTPQTDRRARGAATQAVAVAGK